MVAATTPMGLGKFRTVFTQGSSFLATLGFGPESLWDSFATIAFEFWVMINPGREGEVENTPKNLLVEPLRGSGRRELALTFFFRWSGLTSAATRFMLRGNSGIINPDLTH